MIPSARQRVGPALAAYFETLAHEDYILQPSELPKYVRALSVLAQKLNNPILYPVDQAAERFLGAVIGSCGDTHEVSARRTSYAHRDVLVVFVAAASTIELETSARHLTRLGARSVFIAGCWLNEDQPSVPTEASVHILQPRHRLTSISA